MISDNYEHLLGKFGALSQAEALTEASRAAVSRRLPPELAGFLSSAGLGTWLDGRFQFCDPQVFQPVIDAVPQGDRQFEPDRTALFGFGAFGQSMAWNADHGLLEVDLPRLTATVSEVIGGSRPDNTVLAVLAGIDELDYATGTRMTSRARR